MVTNGAVTDWSASSGLIRPHRPASRFGCCGPCPILVPTSLDLISCRSLQLGIVFPSPKVVCSQRPYSAIGRMKTHKTLLRLIGEYALRAGSRTIIYRAVCRSHHHERICSNSRRTMHLKYRLNERVRVVLPWIDKHIAHNIESSKHTTGDITRSICATAEFGKMRTTNRHSTSPKLRFRVFA